MEKNDVIISEKNPIIKDKGVCDPHIHIFNNKAYLYATHDFSKKNSEFCMKDWQIWSSPDLIRWTLESTFKPEDTYMGASDQCWATDAASRNDKYYFYFSNGMENTGVAVANKPGGPFVDALAKPIIDKNLTKTKEYDPSIFIDDDDEKTPYIVFGTPIWAGGDSYYIAKMNEDMVSLAEKPKKIILDDLADDKPFLHKKDGTYYLTWASYYAISNNVYGPYKLIGNIGASADHGSFFEWNNQWFNAFTIFDPSTFHRATGICYVHYKDNKEMVTDQMIVEYGVGQYNSEWNKIEAEWYMASHNIKKKENPRYGFDIVDICNDSYIYFPNVHNLKKNTNMCFYAACNSNEGGTIEVRQDSIDGKLLGSCKITNTGNWDWRGYRTFLCKLDNEPGSKNIYLVFKGKEKDMFRLDWFNFFE